VSETDFVHPKAVELGKLAVRMTSVAGSGHPSSALSLTHIVTLLMYRHMRWDPSDPWDERADRLVLSEGHAVPIIYAAYADLGGMVGRSREDAHALTVTDVEQLRELQSELDGHPNPAEGFPFFDAATGSLGQGLSVGAGLAAAARTRGIEKRIFVLIGDGEAREGQIWEAADFVVDHKLSNVCAVFNCNGEGQADDVSAQQSADALERKMAAFGWEAVQIDGHDPAALDEQLGRVGSTRKPLAIIARTVKGWGAPSLQEGNWHGKPPKRSDLEKVEAELDETLSKLGGGGGSGTTRPTAPAQARPARASGGEKAMVSFEEACERNGFGAALKEGKLATRRAYGVALTELGRVDPRVVALDGDVRNSTFSEMFLKAFPDRFFECKIAEQNMVSVAVGMAAGGKLPFVSTFAKFLSRAYDQVELALIGRANIKLVGSHAGVSLGPDGPSQMSLPDVAYFRSFSRVDDGSGRNACTVFLPSDAVAAYRLTELMARHDGMCYMRTHRPDVSFLYPFDASFEVGGSHRLREGADLTLVGSGYMVTVALEAAERLAGEGVGCNVFDAYTLPLNCEPVMSAAKETNGRILVVEDNYAGGVHAELAEAAAAAGDVRVAGMTCRRVPKSGRTAEDVLRLVGLSVDDIVSKAREVVA